MWKKPANIIQSTEVALDLDDDGADGSRRPGLKQALELYSDS